MKALTERQKAVLQYLKDYLSLHHYPPTVREIAANFEISVKGAYDHLKALEKKGTINTLGNRSRAIEIVENENTSVSSVKKIPLLGNVAAGIPLMARENFEGYVEVSSECIRNGSFFALHVKGDSMINAGILDGDIAVIQQQSLAENGQIVVAMIEEAITLKRFFKEPNRVKLKSENKAYPPIYTRNVQILGKLVKIMRNYA